IGQTSAQRCSDDDRSCRCCTSRLNRYRSCRCSRRAGRCIDSKCCRSGGTTTRVANSYIISIWYQAGKCAGGIGICYSIDTVAQTCSCWCGDDDRSCRCSASRLNSNTCSWCSRCAGWCIDDEYCCPGGTTTGVANSYIISIWYQACKCSGGIGIRYSIDTIAQTGSCWYGDDDRSCRCSASRLNRYRSCWCSRCAGWCIDDEYCCPGGTSTGVANSYIISIWCQACKCSGGIGRGYSIITVAAIC